MPSYSSPTVVLPDEIPAELLTDEDRKIIEGFDGSIEEHGGRVYIFSEEGFASIATIDGEEVEEETLIETFRNIIERSGGKIPFITLQRVHTASRMVPDSYYGSVVVISDTNIFPMDTQTWAEEKIAELKGEKNPEPTTAGIPAEKVLEWMREAKDWTLDLAKDKGFEGDADNAEEVRDFLGDTEMDHETYARVHRWGAQINMGIDLIKESNVSDDVKADAANIAAFAYDVVNG